ncbi:MAG: tRNA pseudouridine(38-40) synthase TruA [Ignavibacteria bacterium]|nr:MAG: tRNA pseudouridine(38-40) synthase TruA [Ignavibacteria bacterium]
MSESRPQRFKILIEFDGTDFVGWQIQPNGRSVQGEIEAALHKLFGVEPRVHGAGRTDAGVHATGMTAHFDLDKQIDAYTLRRALNAELKADITIREADIVDGDFHARFSASSRSYVYSVAHERISLDRRQQWILFARLDHDRLEEAVGRLAGTHDFKSFSKYVPDQTHHYCHVFEITWQRGDDVSRLHIRANRFLQGMVRCIVGGLVQVGRGKLSPDDLSNILAARDRSRAPMLAPPHGLVLTAVGYDQGDRTTISRIIDELQLGT